MSTALWLLVSILAILITASTTSAILKRSSKINPDTLSNLDARIQAWWWMVFVLCLAMLFGRIGILVLFCMISFFVLRELLSPSLIRKSDHTVLAMCFYFILPIQYLLVLFNGSWLYLNLIPIFIFILIPIVGALAQDTQNFLERMSKLQFILMISVYCLSYVPAILNLDIPNASNMYLIVFLIAVVQASDVLQYINGKIFGKKKILPNVSPSKTIAGTVGGIFCAMLLAVSLRGITPFTWWQAALIGFVICVLGFFGGVVMSAIKRDFGVKDWGDMIKGHGGMLDRVDSLCFSAPIFFYILKYFY